jgi:sterol desaturase/sphingolipid hydroxylase (fatty acid hydroxylase superfamily)
MILFWIYIFTWHRLVLAVLLAPAGFAQGISWWRIFFQGARFDCMVTAYLCGPLLLSLLIPLLTGRPLARARERWHRAYLILLTLAVGGVTALDFAGFVATDDRWNQNWKWAEFEKINYWVWPLLGAELLVAFLVLYQARRWRHMKMDLSQVTGARWFFCALLLVLMGRGSLGPYHLDLRFAAISDSPVVQRVIIPSCYALDQAWRGRR